MFSVCDVRRTYLMCITPGLVVCGMPSSREFILGGYNFQGQEFIQGRIVMATTVPVASGVDIQVREDQGVQGPVFDWPVKRYHMSRIT
jgi:hypothetical protein